MAKGYGAYNQAFADIGKMIANAITRHSNYQDKVNTDFNKFMAQDWANKQKDLLNQQKTISNQEQDIRNSSIVSALINGTATPQSKAEAYSQLPSQYQKRYNDYLKGMKLFTPPKPKTKYLYPSRSKKIIKMTNGVMSFTNNPNLTYDPNTDKVKGYYTKSYLNKSDALFNHSLQQLIYYKTALNEFKKTYPNFKPLTPQEYANLGGMTKTIDEKTGKIKLIPNRIVGNKLRKYYDKIYPQYKAIEKSQIQAEAAKKGFISFTEQGLAPSDVAALNAVDAKLNDTLQNLKNEGKTISKKDKAELAAQNYLFLSKKLKLKDKRILGDYFFAKYGYPLNQTKVYQKIVQETLNSYK